MDVGHRANELVGWAEFTRGFVDPAIDVLFGAEPTAANRFFVAADVDYDPDDERLFVADIHNHRFLIFDIAAGFSTEQGAIHVLGQPDFITGGASDADPFGNVNTPNPGVGCAAGVNACGLHRAWAVEYDANHHRLFGADPDNNRILVWDLKEISDGMPAAWVLGQKSFTSRDANVSCDGATSGKTNACGLSRPNDMLYDESTDRLFVADSGNNRVLVFELGGGIESGMAATAVLGQPSLSARAAGTGCGGIGHGITDECSLSLPTSLAYDDVRRRLFVSDYDAHRVVVYDLGAIENGMLAAAVLGQPDFATGTANTSCGGGASGDENVNACGFGIYGTLVAYAGESDRLFVSDVANHRVLAFDVSSIANGEPAIGVLGQVDFSTGYVAADIAWGGSTGRDLFNTPQGMVYDPMGDRLFVTDGGNHRVLAFGANVGGDPVVVEGNVETTTTTEDDDGNTIVDITDDEGDGYSVSFPPGTEPLEGDEEITVTVEQGSWGPVVQVDAELPPGQTKSITMPRMGWSTLCIDDHAGAEIETDFIILGWLGCRADVVTVPGAGGCQTFDVEGDPGDNPTDPGDPDGVHPVTVCTSDDGGAITISGLRHSLVGATAPSWASRQAAPVDADSADEDAEPEVSGCSTSGGGAGWAAALVALVALFASRPRPLRAPARRRARPARR